MPVIPVHWGVFFALLLILPGLSAAELATAPAQLREVPREYRLDGVVEAINQTTVSAQTSGAVQEILFDVDDFVEKGQVIVRLRATEQQSRLAQAEAELDAANARLEQARKEYRRIKGVFEKDLVAKAEMDKASAALKAAEAGQDAAEAGLEQAREQLEYTQVRAPYSGVVTQRHIELGEVAQPGQPLMSGVSVEELRVLVDVPQSLIPPVRNIGKARVELPDGHWVDAVRITVFPFADPASNTFRVRIYLPENVRKVFPGMFVKTAFVTGARNELVVPAEAVVYRSEVTAVYVVDEEGRASLRHVRVGRENADGTVSLLAGLDPDERVALDPVAAGVVLKRQRAEAQQ